MNEFEKINSFLEGELDSTSENELFSEMANNEALRGELKNLLAISAAVKNNKQAFAKNEKTKKAVFAAIGLSVPVADAVTGGVVTAAAGATVGYGLKSLLATGLLSALVTAIILWNIGDGSSNISKIENKHLAPNLVMQMPAEINYETPIVSSKEVKVVNSDSKYIGMYNDAVRNNQKLIAQNNALISKIDELNSSITYIRSEKMNNNTELLSLQNSLNNSNDNYADLESKYNENLKLVSEMSQEKTQFEDRINSMKTENAITPLTLQTINSNSRLSAEWKGSQTYNTNTYELNNEAAAFNNNSLSIMYNFQNGFSIGSELRQETFLLEFNGIDANNVNYLYRQEPNFTTLSLLGRYTLDMSETIDPFAQMTFGGNRIGVVGRVMGGFIYSPYQNLNMIFGLEYNNMFFQYQGDRFNSGKIGLNYGVSVQF